MHPQESEERGEVTSIKIAPTPSKSAKVHDLVGARESGRMSHLLKGLEMKSYTIKLVVDEKWLQAIQQLTADVYEGERCLWLATTEEEAGK